MELSKHRRETRDVSGLSWDHICKKILEIQKKIENERK
jgi:hypothetical protein